MKSQHRSIKNLAILLPLSWMLLACKPPVSGESTGWKYPILQFQLARQNLSTQLPMPVKGITSAQINDTWGAARGQNRKHEGIDIFAKRGTEVLSTTQGIVAKVGLDSLGGKVVWVVGPDLSRHYYAHLEAYAPHLDVGDWVEQGAVLGYVGNTGNAKNTPPHLHYGIYFTGQGAVNPYPYLSHKKGL
ncbi:M23 family metallopeptidase [Acinetobacter tandoii]|uniref:M23 family metallopeptidase n=1 Tax=Acinetobacter TaxID=469 RepID=UPI001FB68B2F|nr:M23 family metallopeptidase [Acinetobacter sp. PK01]UOG19571.1 M23 family metallopeptidase [Acinetobacter sp. PK01]